MTPDKDTLHEAELIRDKKSQKIHMKTASSTRIVPSSDVWKVSCSVERIPDNV